MRDVLKLPGLDYRSASWLVCTLCVFVSLWFNPIAARQAPNTVIRTIIFDPEGHRVAETGPPVIRRCLTEPGHLLWLDLQEPAPMRLALVQESLGSIRSPSRTFGGGQRPKLDEYDGHYYLVCYALMTRTGFRNLEPVQLNVFVGANYVLTIHPAPIGVLRKALPLGAGQRITRTGSAFCLLHPRRGGGRLLPRAGCFRRAD